MTQKSFKVRGLLEGTSIDPGKCDKHQYVWDSLSTICWWYVCIFQIGHICGLGNSTWPALAAWFTEDRQENDFYSGNVYSATTCWMSVTVLHVFNSNGDSFHEHHKMSNFWFKKKTNPKQKNYILLTIVDKWNLSCLVDRSLINVEKTQFYAKWLSENRSYFLCVNSVVRTFRSIDSIASRCTIYTWKNRMVSFYRYAN